MSEADEVLDTVRVTLRGLSDHQLGAVFGLVSDEWQERTGLSFDETIAIWGGGSG